jgi:hypothetical protein
MPNPELDAERVVIPPRPTKAFAAEAANDLSASIALIRRWGVEISESSRPSEALRILRDVAETGNFAPSQRGDDLGIRALQLALDLKAIADTLPRERITDFRRDLIGCVAGKLHPPESDLGPLQLQSQLVIRAAIAKMGEEPEQPRHSGAGGRKKPDILLHNGISTYAIEVKRPAKSKNITSLAEKAAGQVAAAGVKGGIVLDITDCLGTTDPDKADAEVLRWVREVGALFFTDGVGYKPDCSHILMVTVLARPAWTVNSANQDVQALVHSTSAGYAFGIRAGTLDHIRARWLRCLLSKGLNRLGFTAQEA